MKTLITIILAVTLSGCYPNVNQYRALDSAFLQGCVSDSIDSKLESDGDKQTITATCTKAK